MKNLWIFDFDGTLADSEIAIKKCYEKVTQELIPKRVNFIKKMSIGPTLDQSARIILTKKNLNLLKIFKDKFIDLYDKEILFETKIYRNVNETLKKLVLNGHDLAIATNKRSVATKKLIDNFGWNSFFKWIACVDDYTEIKSKVEMLKLIEINKSKYNKIFFVGDTISDGQAANHHNFYFIKASYGYGSNDNWKEIKIYKDIDDFQQILSLN